MTGYANASASASSAPAAALHEAPAKRAERARSDAAVTVEIRSVNGRFLDVAMRLPDELRGLEPALRAMLTARFKRGKIELRVTGSGRAGGAAPEPRAEPHRPHPTPRPRRRERPRPPAECTSALRARGAAVVPRHGGGTARARGARRC